MKNFLLKGVPPAQRLRASLLLITFVGLLILSKQFNVLPSFLDELPLHTETCSIDIAIQKEKEVSPEIIAMDYILDDVFYFIRDDLGAAYITRFISKVLLGLIDTFNNFLKL